MSDDKWEMGIELKAFNGSMRRRRKQLGLTQQDLAEFVGCSNSLIGHFERLMVKPQPEQLSKIAQRLGCEEKDIWPEWLEAYREPLRAIGTKMVSPQEFSALTSGMHRELKALPAHLDSIEEDELRRLSSDGISAALATLPPRQQEVIRLRFGLDDGKVLTLAECGQKMGIGSERVRQLQSLALVKLRTEGRIRLLGDPAKQLIGES